MRKSSTKPTTASTKTSNTGCGDAGRTDLYQAVTDAILAELEVGLKPWRRPWRSTAAGFPLRHTGQPYRGINTLVLWMAICARRYTSPYFMTYRQAQELGGQVRRGEKATTITYSDTLRRVEETPDGEEEERRIWFLKSYAVFNACQIDGLPERFHPASNPAEAAPVQRIEVAERFFANTGADIRPGGQRAFYTPNLDYIRMPATADFIYPEAYYATLAHEMGHWTGHPSRLDRDTIMRRHSEEARAVEEILAELVAAFTCASLGIDHDLRQDSTAYIGSWLRVLGSDKRFIFAAAAHAQRACDYLWSLQPKERQAGDATAE
jgi:antirestriction protein ArdC